MVHSTGNLSSVDKSQNKSIHKKTTDEQGIHYFMLVSSAPCRRVCLSHLINEHCMPTNQIAAGLSSTQ